MNRFVLPLVVFVGLAALLWKGLELDPRKIPSALLAQPAPDFVLSHLDNPEATFSPSDMAGKVWLLNVWASWCVACRQEHPIITTLSREVEIVGLNYKDDRHDAEVWLATWGNPYLVSAFDRQGDVGIDYGVYGVPETFVIDQEGLIRHKHIGPVSESDADDILLPLIRKLAGGDV